MSSGRCEIPTKRGTPCRAAPLTGYVFCAAHDPRQWPVEALGGPLDGETLRAEAGAVPKWGYVWRIVRRVDGTLGLRGENWPIPGEEDIGTYDLVWLSSTVPRWVWEADAQPDWYIDRLRSGREQDARELKEGDP